NRRSFAGFAAAVAGSSWLSARTRRSPTTTERRRRFANDPFAMGVASGDPSHDGMVLWTRLVPEPFAPRGGMPNETVTVGWEIANDEAMRNVVQRGTALATVELGHSVHVELQGLQPDRVYWYRFRVGDADSPIGRTRTLPAANAMPQRARFAITSCQNWEQGLFTAYEQMRADDPDLVFHLGDYIYEYEAGRNGKVRTHHGKEIETLDDYRMRHAQYRSDPLLQAMHAHCPWFVTWDDHEVDNNYAGAVSEQKDVSPEALLRRRAAAYQAYYEAMPLRASCLPIGPDMRLYRKASYGRLAELFVLDTRQYRSDQPNNDKRGPLHGEALAAGRTLLGADQRLWLKQGLLDSRGTWNVLAQQVMMACATTPVAEGAELSFSMDQWPGYAHERADLLRFFTERKVANPVVLTGDIHSNWANELRIDDRDEKTPVVAAEFVATSLSSGGDGGDGKTYRERVMAQNPGVRYHNQQRGYLRCTIDAKTWVTDYVVMDKVTTAGGKATVATSLALEGGDSRLHVR
ncbi:MAG: alkaline phosphatase, partial [Planctomycetota bacterium]